MPSLLAVSIGNTRVARGLFERSGASPAPALVCVDWCALAEHAEFWATFEPAERPDAVVIASVNPQADGPAVGWAAGRTSGEPLRFPEDIPPPIENRCRPRDATGADRLAAAVAAQAEFGSPCIVVDAGTAVTVDAVGGDPPAFLGGAILPGARLAAGALARGTSLVPELPSPSLGPVIGAATADAVASGVLRGLAGAVDRLVADMAAEVGGSPAVVATGGDAELLTDLCHTAMQVRPNLVLSGLALAYFAASPNAPA